MEIFPLKFSKFQWRLFVGDLSYEDLFIGDFFLWKFEGFFLLFFYFLIFFLKIYSLEILPWKLEIFFMKSYPEEHLKIFKEDLLVEIFPLKYGDFSFKIHSGDFSIAFLKNFNEDLFIGDFSWKIVWRFFLLKICSWRFFLEDLKSFKKVCSWKIFISNM